jgi:hypothetical protein
MKSSGNCTWTAEKVHLKEIVSRRTWIMRAKEAKAAQGIAAVKWVTERPTICIEAEAKEENNAPMTPSNLATTPDIWFVHFPY